MHLREICLKIKRELNQDVKILLYESDPFLLELILEILKHFPIETKPLKILKDFPKSLLEDPHQIFILSLETSSPEDLNIIKEAKNLDKDLLIYTMIEFHKNLDIDAIFMAGADEVIFKPFSIGEFRARLLRLLKEYYLTKKLERLIIEDPLTKVFNRRCFESSLREEVYRALRYRNPLTLLVVDLDNFKWYNDTFGHTAGDQVLIAIGDVLCNSTRLKIDKVCRYGGDEFTVILPYTDWKKSLSIVNRIFDTWEKLSFKPVTLSVGIAQLIERSNLETTCDDLVNRADTAMYKAKKIKGNSFFVDEETLKVFGGEELPAKDSPFQASQ